MSTEIDTRIVSMKFDARDFDNNVQETMSLLDRFKEQLNFKGATKGIEDITKVSDKVRLTHLEEAAIAVEAKFSAMSVVAISAINNIVNSAMNAGKQIIKSLSVDQITSGFSKYESKMTSVQTIMNATGLSIEEVSAQLDKLIWFTDETSYSFTDMVNNVGKFTSNQIDLGVATKAMMGIANAAGLAGASVENASHAMDGFSKAMGKGYMENRNWEWIRTAKMDTASFKQLLLDAAVAEGTLIKVQDGLYETLKGNEVTIADFQSFLSDKWLNNDVMLRGLSEFGDYAEAVFEMCQREGILASEAIERLSGTMSEMGEKGFRASQEAKTFTDAINATKDAVSSKWMQTFEMIFGNYEEAKVIWTELTEVLYDVFAASGDVRNEMLRSWVDMGGRVLLIDTIKDAYQSLLSIVTPLKTAISELFPATQATTLIKITNQIREFVKSLEMSEKAAYSLKVIFKTLLLPVKAVFTALEIGILTIGILIKTVAELTDSFLSMLTETNPIEDFFRNLFGDERYARLMDAMAKIVYNISSGFSMMAKQISNVIKGVKSSNKLTTFLQNVVKILEPIGDLILDGIVYAVEMLANLDFNNLSILGKTILTEIGNKLGWIGTILVAVLGIIKSIGNTFTSYFGFGELFANQVDNIDEIRLSFLGLNTTISNFKSNFTLDSMFSGLSGLTSGLTTVVNGLSGSFTNLVTRLSPAKILIFAFGVALTGLMISLSTIGTTVANAATAGTTLLNNLSTAVKNFGKPSKIIQIGKALAVLAGAVVLMSLANPQNLGAAVAAMGGLALVLGALTGALALIESKTKNSEKGMASLTASLMKISLSLLVLAGALAVLGSINIENLNGKIATIIVILVSLGTVVTLMSKFAKKDISKMSGTLIAFAISLSVMVNSLKKLENFNGTALLNSIGSLITLMGLLALMSRAMESVKFGGAAGVTLMIGNIFLLVVALEAVGSINIQRIAQGLPAFIGIITMLGLLMTASKAAGENAAKAGIYILAISGAMYILGEAIKVIGGFDTKVALQGSAIVAVLLGIFAGLTAVTSLIGEHTDKISKALVMMSICVMLLSVVVSYLGKLSLKEAITGAAVVSVLLGVVAGIMKLNSVVLNEGQKLKSGASAMMAMAALLGVTTSALMLLTLISNEDSNTMIKSAAALSVVMISMGVAIKLMEGFQLTKAISMATGLIVLFGPLAIAMAALNAMEINNGLVEKAGALGILLFSLSVAMKIMPDLSEIREMDLGTFIVLTVVLGELSGVLWLLNGLDPTHAIPNAVALSLLLIALAGAVKILPTLSMVKSMTGAYVAMVELAALVSAMSLMLLVLKNVDPISSLANAASLSLLLLALASAVRILPDVALAQNMTGAYAAMVELAALVSAMSLMLLLLDGIDPIGSIANAVSLSILLNALAFAAGILPSFEKVDIGKSIGVLIVLTGCLTVLGLVLAIIGGMHIENNLGNVISLSIMLLALVGAARLLSGMGDISLGGALKAIAAVSVAVLAVIGILQIIQAVPWNNTEKIIIAFGTVGAALGEAIGQFVGHLIGGISDVLPRIGKNLSDFISNLLGFTETLKTIDGSVLSGAATLAGAILAITGAEVVTCLASIFGLGKNPLTKFGMDLVEFGPLLAQFASSIRNIDSINFSFVSEAVKKLAEAYGVIKDGLIDKIGNVIFGDNTLEKFGEDLAKFGPFLVQFCDSVKNLDTSGLMPAIVAAKRLADFEEALPKHGGWVQTILGDSDLGTFGTNIAIFGAALVEFSNIVSGKGSKKQKGGASGGIDTAAMNKAVAAGEALAKLENSLRSQGGVFQSIFGNADLGSFGDNIAEFGLGMKAYSDSITKDGGIDPDAINESVVIGQALSDLEKGLGAKNGHWQSMFGGTESLGDFGVNIKAFGEGVAEYYKSLDGVDFGRLSESAIIGTLFAELEGSLGDSKSLWEKLFGGGEKDFSDFGKSLTNLGSALSQYNISINSVNFETIDSSISALNDLVKLSNKINSDATSGLTNFATAITSLANTSISGFVAEFYNGKQRILDAVNNVFSSITVEIGVFDGVGEGFITTIVNEIIQNESRITFTGSDLIGFLLMGMSTQHDNIKAEGSYLITCLINGISSQKKDAQDNTESLLVGVFKFIADNQKLYKAAKEVGQNAIKGLIEGIREEKNSLDRTMQDISQSMIDTAKETLDEHSPSVEFETIGKNVIQGEIDGIEEKQESLNATIRTSNADLIKQSKEDFAIRGGTSEVMRDQVGVYLVKGIAEGIYTDTSAEEAASLKAQNITKAFQAGLNRLSLDTEISDLQYKNWEAKNPNATDEEIRTQKMLMYERQLANEGQAFAIAQAKYNAAVLELGENAYETQEMLRDLQQEELNYTNMINEYLDIVNRVDDSVEESTTSFQYLAVAYNNWLREWRQSFLELGYTQEQIEEMARGATGFNPNLNTVQTNERVGFKDIWDKYMLDEVEVQIDAATAVIQERTESSLSSGTSAAVSSGLTSGVYAGVSDFANGITTGETADIIAGTLGKVLGVDEKTVASWFPDKNSLISIWENIVNGADIGLSGLPDAFTNWFSNAGMSASNGIALIRNVLGINSPSKVMIGIGHNIVDGLAIGLTDDHAKIIDAFKSIAEAAIDATAYETNTISDIGRMIADKIIEGLNQTAYEIPDRLRGVFDIANQTIYSYQYKFKEAGHFLGDAMVSGLIDGVQNRQAEAINAIVSLAVDAYQAACQQLGINGINLSLVNGITESTLPAISERNMLDWDNHLPKTSYANTAIAQAGTISATLSTAIASGIASGMNNVNTTTNNQNSTTSSVTYNFYQTNNSPKALSRIDIYRDTNNLLSSAKGVT